MPSSEINEDVKRDLEVLSMRGAFNPKRHYKVGTSHRTCKTPGSRIWMG